MEGYVRFTTVSLRPKNNDENICFYTETVCDETSIKNNQFPARQTRISHSSLIRQRFKGYHCE